MAILIMRRGPEPGKVYTLTDHITQIGRGSRNDIVLNDNEVSREHCRLVLQGEQYELIDLDSSNGTYVNGQRVRDPWLLSTECIIELGDSITFEYRPYSESEIPKPLEETETDLNEQTFLVVTVSSQTTPAIYPLEGEVIDIGRGTSNKVIIIEPEVSRHHLRLRQDVLGYKIEDMNSTNGTTLNGSPLKEQHILRPGDVMRIGANVVILYTNDPDPFLPKKRTATLEDKSETREIARRKAKSRSGAIPLLDNISTSEVGTGVEPDALKNHVLLAYAREDWEGVIAPIVNHLYEADIPVWVDQYLVPGADDWLVAIDQARMECWMLMVIVSEQSMDQEHVVKIWRHFHNREKPVLLVMKDNIERLPIGTKSDLKVQFSASEPDASFARIVNAIKQLRGS